MSKTLSLMAAVPGLLVIDPRALDKRTFTKIHALLMNSSAIAVDGDDEEEATPSRTKKKTTTKKPAKVIGKRRAAEVDEDEESEDEDEESEDEDGEDEESENEDGEDEESEDEDSEDEDSEDEVDFASLPLSELKELAPAFPPAVAKKFKLAKTASKKKVFYVKALEAVDAIAKKFEGKSLATFEKVVLRETEQEKVSYGRGNKGEDIKRAVLAKTLYEHGYVA